MIGARMIGAVGVGTFVGAAEFADCATLLVLRCASRNVASLLDDTMGDANMPNLRRVGALGGVGSFDNGPSRSSATPIYLLLGC